LRFVYLAWVPLLIGLGLPMTFGLSEHGPWGYLGYRIEGFRNYPIFRIGLGLFGSLAALGLLLRKNWGLSMSCVAGGAGLVDAGWVFVANGTFMFSMIYGSYEPAERLIRQCISFTSDVALLVAWPLLLSAVLMKDPYRSPESQKSSTSKRRILFASSAAASLLFFYVYRLIYPW
jgi:hypothetical protein